MTGMNRPPGAITSTYCQKGLDLETYANTLYSVKAPMIQSTAGNGDGTPKGAEANGKRTRENDSGQAPPAKKVDAKSEATAAQ